MNSDTSPTTNTFTYYDAFSKEWVTTFTVRHKINLEDTTKNNALDLDIKNFIEEAKSKFNSNTAYELCELPTLNDVFKPISNI